MGWGSPGRGELPSPRWEELQSLQAGNGRDCVLRGVVSLARGAGRRGHAAAAEAPGGSEEGPGGHRGAFPEVNTCPGGQRGSAGGSTAARPGPHAGKPGLRQTPLCIPAQATFSPGSTLSPWADCSTAWSLRSASSSSNYDPAILKDMGLYFWLKGPGGNKEPRPTGRKMSDYGLAQLRPLEPLKKKEEVWVVLHGGAEAPRSSAPRTYCPRLLGFEEIQLTRCCLLFCGARFGQEDMLHPSLPVKPALPTASFRIVFPWRRCFLTNNVSNGHFGSFHFVPWNWGPQRAGSPLRCRQDGSHLCRLAVQGPEGMAWGRHGQALSLAGGIHTADKNLVSTQPGQTGHLK